MKRTKVIIMSVLAFILLWAVTAAAGPVLDRILKKGELVVGTSGDQPPLTAKTRGENVIGLDADLAQLMAAAMGVTLKFKVMPFPDLLPALEEGKLDMILSGMTITPKRNLKVAFVGPYYISGKGILAKAEKIASSEDAADINRPDVTLAALQASTSQLFAERVLPKARLVKTRTLDEALNLLFENKVDALVADYPFCVVAAFRYSDRKLLAGEARFTYEPLGIALPADDPLLVNWVQNLLNRLEQVGDLDVLADRWFRDGTWIKELP